ncbi:MAG: hypothetical protein M3R61_09090, partial [Chloroflexota bacterium]|nr:hypothetical protein [Chloroflexota bacterium]
AYWRAGDWAKGKLVFRGWLAGYIQNASIDWGEICIEKWLFNTKTVLQDDDWPSCRFVAERSGNRLVCV